MRRIALMVPLVACGRSGFGIEIDAAPDGDSDVPAGAVVAIFGERPDATFTGVTFDTYITSEVPQDVNNYGASSTMTLEGTQKRSLLRFDLTAIPAGKVIAAARFHVWVSYVESGTSGIALSQITEAWTEGAQAGGAGVANWTQRSASQSWTTPGAGSPGSSGAQLATVTATGIGELSVDVPAATVQGWVDLPASNFGVVLTGSGSELRLSTRNAPTATERPELVVTYFP